jgi:hypothetical protein
VRQKADSYNKLKVVQKRAGTYPESGFAEGLSTIFPRQQHFPESLLEASGPRQKEVKELLWEF